MPTPEQVTAFQLLRSKFLGALYDAEPNQHQRLGLSQVADILDAIGSVDLDTGQTTRLVKGLEQAHLIEGMSESMGDLYAPEVRLTAYGRATVEDWVTAQTKTTPELPISYNNVYNTTINSPQGSVVNVGSTDTTITVNNQFGEKLNPVIAAARTLLEQDTTLSDDDREEIEDEIAILKEQTALPEANKSRVKRALTGLSRWAVTAVALAGSQEVQHLTTQALQAITD